MKKKKNLIFILILALLFFCGCSQKQVFNPTIDVYSTNMEQKIEYSFDEINRIIEVQKTDDAQHITIKLTPPQNLINLSEVQVWCNGESFFKNDNFFSNGKEIFVTLPSGERTTTVISVKWNYNSEKQDYYVKF